MMKNFCPDFEEKPPVPPNKKLEISELSWTDKEKILRILFAKMNGVSIVQNHNGSNRSDSSQEHKRDIHVYRGGDYPIGPKAFSGSLGERVDRIISIDDEGPKEEDPDLVDLNDSIKVEQEESEVNIPIIQENSTTIESFPTIQVSSISVPVVSIPVVQTTSFEEGTIPIIVGEEEGVGLNVLPPINVIAEEEEEESK